MEQISLYGEQDMAAMPSLVPVVDPEMTAEERFARFHELNPHVLQLLVRRAERKKRAGRRRVSMKKLFEDLRDEWFETRGEPFKLNNTFTQFYARLIRERRPDLGELFEFRATKAERRAERQAERAGRVQ